MSSEALGSLNWDKMQGLLPAVVQDADTLQVLMLGYLNQAALMQTQTSGWVTFYSRSRQRLWQKGELSGNKLRVVAIQADCDEDALLISARPEGPTCHRGTTGCFGADSAPGCGFLAHLGRLIDRRHEEPMEGSYTSTLLAAGTKRMAQKVAEEAVEVALAAMEPDPEAVAHETADLIYHVLVLLRGYGLPFYRVIEVLRARHRPESR